jgi:alkane 1-monooxygenase
MYALCCAQPGALNATVGHELLHRKSLVHKIFGTLSYGKLGYSHYFIQHVRGHHKNVATPGDNSTARADESVYQFYMRVVPCGYIEVWEYEQNRLKQLNGGTNSFIDSLLHNRLISFTLCEALYFGIIYLVFGGKGLLFHIITNIIVLSQFEAVNYLEHYGLLRKMENGVYESVKITHSWNAPQLITNYLLFKLQRHSDHHANAYKPY